MKILYFLILLPFTALATGNVESNGSIHHNVVIEGVPGSATAGSVTSGDVVTGDVSTTVAGSSGTASVNVAGSTTRIESQAPDVVIVPNNNTEGCLRVFGLFVSTQDGAGGIGYPWRSKECDLEAAADDAFAQGNAVLGWTFKCKQKSLKKAFGGRDWRAAGEQACLDASLPAEVVPVLYTAPECDEREKRISESRDCEK